MRERLGFHIDLFHSFPQGLETFARINLLRRGGILIYDLATLQPSPSNQTPTGPFLPFPQQTRINFHEPFFIFLTDAHAPFPQRLITNQVIVKESRLALITIGLSRVRWEGDYVQSIDS